MPRSSFVLASMLSLLSACGAPSAPSTHAEEPADRETASGEASDSLPSLVGAWHAELSGGPVAGTRDYVFEEDGTYRMDGYPSIQENGRYELSRGEDGTLRLRFVNRLACGPCDSGPELEVEDDVERVVYLGEDGSTLTIESFVFSRQP